MSISRLLALASLAFLSLPAATHAAGPVAERGKYLVNVAGCGDCHTPGGLLGKPDVTRALGGSEVGFELPGAGVFYGPNLTPDKETGLGNWTRWQIVNAIRLGKRPDGRRLAPVMPWPGFAHLTDSDAMAIATYLTTLPPVKNKVPGPFGPDEKPTSFVMKVVPAESAATTK